MYVQTSYLDHCPYRPCVYEYLDKGKRNTRPGGALYIELAYLTTNSFSWEASQIFYKKRNLNARDLYYIKAHKEWIKSDFKLVPILNLPMQCNGLNPLTPAASTLPPSVLWCYSWPSVECKCPGNNLPVTGTQLHSTIVLYTCTHSTRPKFNPPFLPPPPALPPLGYRSLVWGGRDPKIYIFWGESPNYVSIIDSLKLINARCSHKNEVQS